MTYWKLGFFPVEKRSLSINMVTLLDVQINVKRELWSKGVTLSGLTGMVVG